MTDEGGKSEAEKIIASVFKRLYIHWDWEDDCRQQIISHWLATQYDPKKPRKDIFAYATRAAMLAVMDWRRETLVAITCKTRITPEPVKLSIDMLFGDDLERFVDAVNSTKLDPENIAISNESPEQDDSQPLNEILEINLPKNKRPKKERQLLRCVELLLEGKDTKEIAKDIGVTVRTIDRYKAEIKDLNKIETYREAHKKIDFLRVYDD